MHLYGIKEDCFAEGSPVCPPISGTGVRGVPRWSKSALIGSIRPKEGCGGMTWLKSPAAAELNVSVPRRRGERGAPKELILSWLL